MAHGLLVTNTAGQVIVSNYTENFHFGGLASFIDYDGPSYTDFPTYGGPYDALDGRVVFNYVFDAPTEPLVFIKPSDLNAFCGLIRKYNVGNSWYMEVMVTGTSTTPPTLYCFTNPEGIVGSPAENHGLIVYKGNGIDRTFDSRYLPLAIIDGGVHVPPEDPTNTDGLPGNTSGHSWNYATLDHDFRSTTRYNTYSITNDVAYTDMMFAAPCLAQATWKRQMSGYKKSCSNWAGSCQEHWSTAIWWVMYRNLQRLRNGSFDSGWGPYAAGYSFSSAAEGGGWFGGDGKSYSTGSAPYLQKSINRFENVFLIADSRKYS